MTDEQDAINLLRELAEKTAFNVHYHERQLSDAHRKVALARALLARSNYVCDPDDAIEYYENDGDAISAQSSEDLLRNIYGDALYSVSWHEQELIKAHEKFATMKKILKRGKFVEIDLVEVDKAAKERANK